MTAVAKIGAGVILSVLFATGAPAGDVAVVVEWPGDSSDVRVIRQTVSGEPASLLIDDSRRIVTITNFEEDWSVSITGGPGKKPQVSVQHTGPQSLEVLLKAYKDRESTGSIDVYLQRPGEKMTLGGAERWIVLELRPAAA